MVSYWERQSFTRYHYGVIGGGLVGLSTALSIRELHPQASIVVLERGVIPRGASTRNAGFACFGSLSELLTDINAMGESKVRKLVEDRWSGLQLLRKRVGDGKLRYQNHGGYELLFESDLEYLERLDYLNDLLRPVFNQTVFRECPKNIRRFGFNGSRVASMVENPLEGQLHAGAMMKSLLDLARSQGIDYLTGTEVTGLDESTKSVRIQVSDPASGEITFDTQRVAVCTNAFTGLLLPTLEIKPARGTIILTKPVRELKFRGAFHYHQGFYYFRNVGGRILFGGGRNRDFSGEETTDFGFNVHIVDHLRQELSTLIVPDKQIEIDQCWSGIMAFGKNKYPLVGLYRPRIGYAVGMAGMGVALGSLVGDQLARLICFSENV